MSEKYSKLDKTVEYDHEAAEQLAEALNEIVELEQRIGDLRELIKENSELHEFVWRTAENKVIALHNIEDTHFGNIIRHLVTQGRSINKAIRAEARKRKMLVPTSVAAVTAMHIGVVDHENNTEVDW